MNFLGNPAMVLVIMLMATTSFAAKRMEKVVYVVPKFEQVVTETSIKLSVESYDGDDDYNWDYSVVNNTIQSASTKESKQTVIFEADKSVIDSLIVSVSNSQLNLTISGYTDADPVNLKMIITM